MITDVHSLAQRLRKARRDCTALYHDYEQHWVRTLTSTTPADRPQAETAVLDVYRHMGRRRPERFVWFDLVPAMRIGLETAMFRRVPSRIHDWKSEGLDMDDGIWERLHPLWKSVRDACPQGAVSQETALKATFQKPLMPMLWEGSRLCSFAGLDKTVPYAPLAKRLMEFQVDAPQIAHAWFSRNVLDLCRQEKDDGLFDAYLAAAENCLLWCPFENDVLLCERPSEVHLADGLLHRDGGPAVRWCDGVLTYALRGLLVPSDVATARPEDLNTQMVVEEGDPAVRLAILRKMPHRRIEARLLLWEDDIDIRREIVTRIGIERVCIELKAQTIDSEEDYELLELNAGDHRPHRYLKMVNPSIGVYHLEGVHPECGTVREALAWRNGTTRLPATLT